MYTWRSVSLCLSQRQREVLKSAAMFSLSLRAVVLLLVSVCPAALVSARPGASPSVDARAPQDQGYIAGTCTQYDRVLYMETVRESAIPLLVRKVDMQYPLPGVVGRETISCVKFEDLQRNGKNGKVTIQKGGPGQKEVFVKLRSERGEGMKWNVYVYGR